MPPVVEIEREEGNVAAGFSRSVPIAINERRRDHRHEIQAVGNEAFSYPARAGDGSPSRPQPWQGMCNICCT